MEPFLAMIMAFGGNFAIRSWQYCSGTLLAINTNTALFSILGTTYGGDGRTTFALPDLRGRAPIGFGQGIGMPYYDLGQTGGQASLTLTLSQMPMHTHPADAQTLQVKIPASTTPGTTNIPGPALVPAALPTVGSGPAALTIKGYAPKDNSTTLSDATITGNINIGMAGNSLPIDIQNPYIAVNYLIAMEGIFPPRP